MLLASCAALQRSLPAGQGFSRAGRRLAVQGPAGRARCSLKSRGSGQKLQAAHPEAQQPPERSGDDLPSPPATEPPAAEPPAAEPPVGSKTKVFASLGVVGGLALLIGGGIIFKDQISAFISLFIQLVDDWGPLGFLAYGVVYAGLEILAVPAIPLTMTAGAIFGVVPGTVVVSIAATAACTGAFLIARYIARDRVAQYASSHPKFAAIDRAIGKDGFRVVVLLRLSPLLPLAASNYLYGLTSVDLGSYVLGSWLGMLPGTAAYVAAGKYGKQLLEGGGALEGPQWWQVGLALGVTALAIGYIGRLASKAMADYDAEELEKKAQ